ncbi:MAG: hypothetical protein JSR54_15530 [Proteobacteria bacterium]|nr:hypothetical protein [Pseudomonadota bacterium]
MSLARLTLTLALLLLGGTARASGDDRLVLIVSASSPVAHLEIIDVRKLFLGLRVAPGGVPLRPLDNRADARMHEAFLQNVLGMSDEAFERRLLAMTLREGVPRPAVYYGTAELLAALASDPSAVSVAWARDVEHDRRVRVLRVLWRD